MDTLQEALAKIKLDLQSAGYARAEVTTEARRREENGKHYVDLTVQLNPGKPRGVRQIEISGNNKNPR